MYVLHSDFPFLPGIAIVVAAPVGVLIETYANMDFAGFVLSVAVGALVNVAVVNGLRAAVRRRRGVRTAG
ncbi:hypothetical protein [Actinoplanes sp. NBRC 101535]|uniref:hypothetical protein n=1 Tax=Actinoplanes sp. NBRC 101535 TaxID=3032196 RepID=UPI0024A04516|nr:hypothetical protein [Actinoplanes sp. NBRC 101535]GLY05746.1 hypothetical protein Acsp01_61250 [Actinoplanes sp. NBRC 101535]